MRVYLAGPITHDAGLGCAWRVETGARLKACGVTPLTPHPIADYRRGYNLTLEEVDKVLTVRDHWFTTKCDVVLANFVGSEKASIGTSIELGWAHEAGVPIVAAIPSCNVHDHPMVLSIVDFRTFTLHDAVEIVLALQGGNL